MTQLAALTILVDACRSMPETKHMTRALKWADHRLEVLTHRKQTRDFASANAGEINRIIGLIALRRTHRVVNRHYYLVRRAVINRLRDGGEYTK